MTAALQLCCILGGYNMKACRAHLLSSTKEIGSLTGNKLKKKTQTLPLQLCLFNFHL